MMVLTTVLIMIYRKVTNARELGGNRMKKNSRFAGFYMGLIFFLMYLPIAVVIVAI